MKHHPLITGILLLTFLAAQFIGIMVVYKYIDPVQSAEQGKTVFKPLPIGERPPIEEKTSYIPVILAILLGTGLLLLLIKFHLDWVWKLWFLIAIVVSLTVALTAFIPTIVAFLVSLAAALWKIFKPNVWIQNFTELFIYGGLAAIFSPMFNLWSISILLILIAIYDAYAVWKSKHMVTLAKSQAKSKIFAGLLIPYKLAKGIKKIPPETSGTRIPMKVRTAILGGGDIGFPLIFAGVVLKQLGLWQSLIIPFFALAGLALLLFIADEKKFYPAMPFISIGCFVGLGVVWVVSLVV